MEEDIKILEDTIKRYRAISKNLYDILLGKDNEESKSYLREATALENLLTRYKQAVDENMKLKENRIDIETKARNYDKMQVEMEQLAKENRTLKRVNKMTEDISIENITQVMNKSYKDFMKEFISKTKIMAKIEELVKKIDGTNKGFIYACEVDLLEELIGETSKTKQEYWNQFDD